MFRWFNSRISKRFLVVVLVSLLFTALVMSVVSITSVRRLGELSARTNADSIETHVRSSMLALVIERAATCDAEFRAAMASAGTVAAQAVQCLGNLDIYGRSAAHGKERLVLDKDKGIFSNGPDALVSSVYWAEDRLDAKTRARLNAISHVDTLLVQAKENSPGARAAWMILADTLTRYYPNTHIVDLMPPKWEFDFRDDRCFTMGAPRKNPDGRMVWSEVYQDTVGQGLVTTLVQPVYSENKEFLGVMGIDFSMDAVVRDVFGVDKSAPSPEGPGYALGTGGFSVLVDRDSRVIALPGGKTGLMGLHRTGEGALKPGEMLGLSLANSANPSVRALARAMARGGRGDMLMDLNGAKYLAVYNVIRSTGWRLCMLMPMSSLLVTAEGAGDTVQASVRSVILSYPLIAMVATLVSMILVLVFIIRRLFSPMRSLLHTVEAVAQGQLDHRVDIPEGDEFGELARAFNHMIDQLVKGRNQLREAEERYRSIFENAVEGVFRSTPDGRFLSVNPSMAEILGYDSPEQIMEEVDDIGAALYVLPAHRAQYLDLLRRDGTVRHFETLLRKRDGTEMWGMFSAKAALGRNGKVLYVDGLLEDITEDRRAKDEVLRLSRELMQAQESERRRIARDLHDNVAQTLSSLRIGCGVLFDGHEDASEDLKRRVEDFSRMLQECIAAIRGMAYELRPSALDELGLVRTLRQYCREYAERTGTETEFVAPGMDGVELSPDMEINLYRIIQEALHNAEKHAGADRISVSLVASYPSVILLITDNGKGFDPDKPLTGGGPGSGMGLSSMRERARLLGGDLEVKTRPGVGVRLRVEVPVNGNFGF
ncbi:PAS domain S-box protein [Desulfocurvus sp. DL9XJH121]